MNNLKITFFGGAGSTTGANIMLEVGSNPTSPKLRGTRILVDCGLLQGARFAEDKNFENFKYNPAEIDFLLITHAHMDHIGKVPKLVRDGFKGKIISTVETMELARPMLVDALKVMQARHPNQTLFEEADINKSFALWEGRSYEEKINLFENCSLFMQDAGHILGSAICNVTCGVGEESKTIAFTGDLGNSPSPILPDTETPKGVDYLVMESVYGDRNHESKDERRQKLKQAILNGQERGGTIVIPAFSIERTQVLLYELNNMIEDQEIPKVPVFLDSPLALKVTDIYKKYQKDFKPSVQQEIQSGDDIFDFPGLQIVRNTRESEEIEKLAGPKIILAGSGMSEGGRVVSHEARFLPDPTATIILVGYQSVGSLGRAIQDGVKEVFIETDGDKSNGKEKVKVRATIENITGYSSHKDSEHLLEFVEKVNDSTSPPTPLLAKERGEGKKGLKRVFVIMGEPKSSLFLTQRIRDYLDIDAVYPEENKEYELK
ncbi:MAG: MBL fold metallo-hydrolase [Candidatus Paceibacterota bacterium]|jgi:metallo-beta-lactamase family protein